jgi:CDP-glycerol glycerophosphotransferase
MSILTLSQARRQAYNAIYFTYGTAGDNLLLLLAAKKYYETTGKKLLLGTMLPEFALDVEYCDAIIGVTNDTVELLVERFLSYGITLNAALYEWEDRHIYAVFCSMLGLSGNITIDPQLDLSHETKQNGRYFKDNQIAIISEGSNAIYKTWGVDKMQSLIDALCHKYNFIQIGAPTDHPLDNTLDKRNSFLDAAVILSQSDLFVGGIGALMHLARSVNCRSVITYSRGEPPLLAHYPCNINVLSPSSCDKCYKQNISVRFSGCDNHCSCCRDTPIELVIKAIENAMLQSKQFPLVSEIVTIIPQKLNGMKLFYYFKNLNTQQKSKSILKMLRERTQSKMLTSRINSNA